MMRASPWHQRTPCSLLVPFAADQTELMSLDALAIARSLCHRYHRLLCTESALSCHVEVPGAGHKMARDAPQAIADVVRATVDLLRRDSDGGGGGGVRDAWSAMRPGDLSSRQTDLTRVCEAIVTASSPQGLAEGHSPARQ